MSAIDDSVDIAIGVIEGKVVARWQSPLSEIEFDPNNAYRIGLMLSKAAMQAYRGNQMAGSDMEFLMGELAQVKVKVSELQRDAMVAAVATILKTLIEQKRSPGYIAMHCVDAVLRETAR